MMKKTIISGASMVALCLLAASCDSELVKGGSGAGYLAPNVDLDDDVIELTGKTESRAEGDALPLADPAAITVQDLSLRVTSEDGSSMKTWETLADYDATTEFRVGTYFVEAFYGDEDSEGFEQSHFYGSETVNVADGQTTTFGFTAVPTKSMVTLKFSEAFCNYMSDWSATYATAAGNSIVAAKDETRPAYVKPGKVTVSLSITKPNGKEGTITAAELDVKAGYSYTINVDMNEGAGAGNAGLSISYQEEVDKVETVDIDITDQLLAAPAPKITADGFVSGETTTVVEGTPTEKLSMNIIAMGGIQSAVLTTISDNLPAAWPSELDLVQATASQQELFTSNGLSVLGLWKNLGEMAVVDFSKIATHLTAKADGANETTFTLTVADKLNRSTEPITLKIKLEPLTLTVENEAKLSYAPGEEAVIEFDYNGNVDDIKFEYLHPTSGAWAAISPTVTAVSRSTTHYRATFAVPESMKGTMQVRMKFNNATKVFHFTTAPFEVSGNENDTYATYAFLTVTPTEGNAAPSLDGATVLIREEGQSDYTVGNATKYDATRLKLTGLTPGKTYTVRVSIDGQTCGRFVLPATEAALQLPNAGMEEGGNGSQYNEKTVAGWGTSNKMTTKSGSNNNYTKHSGTRIEGNGHSGNCAWLGTVGWGSGNTWAGGLSICYNVDPGLLHLGADRTDTGKAGSIDTGDLNCGLSFASRPSSMSFWYKYSPRNSADKGFVEIWVKDANDNIISPVKQANLDASSDFSQYTITFDGFGKPDVAKSAKIYVRFQSTHNSGYLKKDETSRDDTEKTHLGSQLWIDDIQLNY